VYIKQTLGKPVRRLSVNVAGHESRVFVLRNRHDSIEEIVSDLVALFPPPPGSLTAKPVLRSEDRRALTHVRQVYHDMPVFLEYGSSLLADAPAISVTAAPVANAYDVDDDGHALTADDVDPDADVDDKLVMRRVLNRPNASKTDAQLDAELDQLLGGDGAASKKNARAASRSVGKSRDWAAKSRERLQRSFHDVAERLQPQAAPSADLHKVIVNAQLEELRALCEAYAPPLLIVSDAVPLRLAFRIDGAEACELAERAAPSTLLPCQLCVVVQLPIAYPKEAAVVKSFWSLAPEHVDDATAARVDDIARALSAKSAAKVGQPLLHELMTDASDWMAAFVNDDAVVAAAVKHAPSDEITEAHRVAWIHQLKWAFDWNFDQWPSPDNFLFYERVRNAALEQFVADLETHVRARETADAAEQEPLLGWVGATPFDDAALGALSTPRRLLASGRSVLARVLEAYEWSVARALAFAVKPKQPWSAVEQLLGFVAADESSGGESVTDLSASVAAALDAGALKTPAHATQLLVAAIDAKTGVELEKECEICLCDYAASECTALACGHWFCNGCYASYVSLEVSEARVSRLKCPSRSCASPLDNVSAMLLLSGGKAVTRLLRFAAMAHVADDERAQQCQTPDCGVVMHAVDPKARQSLAPGAYSCCDKCTQTKCMRCTLSGHWPASCAVAQWSRQVFKTRTMQSEVDDEMLSLRWIVGNTKDCPKCATPIEKNMGCNHMHCANCNNDFCWVCLASWTGAHYSCTAGREASHASIHRFSAVPLSFIGIRNWHVGRLEFARAFLRKRVYAMADATDDAGDSRVLRDAFQWCVLARQLAINAAEMGECLKTFSMPCQKHIKLFALDLTAIAEQLHDAVFEEPAFDPMKHGKRDMVELAFNALMESSVAAAAGQSGPKRKRLLTIAERAAVLSESVVQFQDAARRLNRVLRTRLWNSTSNARLVRFIAAAKAAGKERGERGFGLTPPPDVRVVRVRVHRAGEGDAVGKELLVSGEWRVFVHEAASTAGVIDDSYQVVDGGKRDPAHVYLASGARVTRVDELNHDDWLFVTAPDEALRVPRVIDAPPVLTPAEARAAKLVDAAPRAPRPSANQIKWQELMRQSRVAQTTNEREREQLWQQYEPSLLELARIVPPSLISHAAIIAALSNTDGDERKALQLLTVEFGVPANLAEQWQAKLSEMQTGRERGRRSYQPISDVWAAQSAHNEAEARRRAVRAFEEADAVRQIRNVLPHVTDRQAARAWNAAGQNVENAMGQLLDGVIQ
jgi:hypothetical protein